jgi:CubicO group peptidase (beta-lactamase class C family)
MLLALFAAALGCATPRPDFAPDRLAKVDAAVRTIVETKKAAGVVVLLAREGRVAEPIIHGSMDVDKPMRADTIFRLYSMTKAITSAAALQLVEEGRIGLDDPIGKHIPELKDLQVRAGDALRPPSRPPTVKDLMLHTAGFTYGGASTAKAYAEKKPLEAKDLDEFARRLADVHLAFDPGSDWHYGVNTDVLGLVVQRAAGKKLSDVLRERIFEPLDMKDAAFHVPADKVARFAATYKRGQDALVVTDAPASSRYLKPPTLESGGGGLVGSGRDYLRFLLMIDGGGALEGSRVLKPESVRLMTTNQLPPAAFPIYFGQQKRHGTGFGLGFSVRTADTEWDPAGRVGEYGWGGAASTHYWCSPKDRLVVVTLEQIMPYTFDTEFALKGPIYDALDQR